MLPRKKHRFNWRARQGHTKFERKRDDKNSQECGDLMEDICSEEVEYGCNAAADDDTNALVLPSKRKKTNKDGDGEVAKKKKLSSAQRKRLQKVVEAKERKAKVSCSLLQLMPIELISSRIIQWKAQKWASCYSSEESTL